MYILIFFRAFLFTLLDGVQYSDIRFSSIKQLATINMSIVLYNLLLYNLLLYWMLMECLVDDWETCAWQACTTWHGMYYIVVWYILHYTYHRSLITDRWSAVANKAFGMTYSTAVQQKCTNSSRTVRRNTGQPEIAQASQCNMNSTIE